MKWSNLVRSIFVTGVTTVALAANLTGMRVSAQEQKGGSGLNLTPLRSELVLDKGKSEAVEVTLTNVSGADIIARPSVNDFEADGTSGEPKIIVDQTKTAAYSVKPFVEKLEDIPMKKDEKKIFKLIITTPQNANPGAYYGVIRYTAVDSAAASTNKDGPSVSLTASVGMVLLVQVPGNITEQIQISEVRAQRNGSPSGIFISSPDRVGIKIANKGNGFSKPFGKVIISNWRGKEVFSYELNNAQPRNNILPSSSRLFQDEIKNVSSFGRYTILANIGHGSGSDIVTAKATFWVLPKNVLIGFAAVIALLVISSYMLYRRRFIRRR